MSELSALVQGVNLVWVLLVTFLIFFMKAGFAMLEAGQVRAKNVANQLTQTLITLCVGLLVYFLLGAGVANLVGQATGPDPVSLSAAFSYLWGGSVDWVNWLFGGMFAIAAANIVSGGVAGRCKPRMYVIYTVAIVGVIYPAAVGLVWNSGFLATLGFHDFAGGMVIHGMGGISGLVAAWVLGSRIDRFDDEGGVNVIPGHSVTLAVLGTLILAFGWYGFNVGTAVKVLTVDGGSVALADFGYVGLVAINTTLGMVTGGLAAGLVTWYRTGKVDTLYLANGMLAGLVGVTGVADAIVWPGALLLGTVAGVQLPLVFQFVERRLRIDDVCAVFPVHGTAGILGIVAFPLVSTATWTGGGSLTSALSQVGIQLAGVAIIGLWTAVTTFALFEVATATGQARVTRDTEEDGLDLSQHGVETYPEFGDQGVNDSAVRTDGGNFRAESARSDD
ncbi:ammonium transporter [Halorientalis pallida]|uniref:ammonium transporter n=1 Tax=Halorientalis pallida TaxID=2479928 RepID=UPI003C703BAD